MRRFFQRHGGRIVVTVVAIFGFFVGAALAPAATTRIGPLTVDVQVHLSAHPGAAVQMPPVGSVRFDTHHTPIAVVADIKEVDVEGARLLLAEPGGVTGLGNTAPDAVRDAALQAGLFALGGGFLGALTFTALLTRRIRGVGYGALVSAVGVAGLGLTTAATFDSTALAQPRFTGVLSSAPYVQRQTETLAERLESYRAGLSDFVESVTTLYALGDRLPPSNTGGSEEVTTVLHISDLHLNPIGYDLVDKLVDQFDVDAVIDTGDLSTWGTAVETNFVQQISGVGVPYVFVRGNHDSPQIERAVAAQPKAVVLDGQVTTVAGLRIAGVADPRYQPAEGSEDTTAKFEVEEATRRLAEIVTAHNADTPDDPVDLALIHDSSRIDPVIGTVPLVLSGHLHDRKSDYRNGTRILVEGSTGGAGVTAAGFKRLTDGKPVPLQASLLYFSKSGDTQGRLLATDRITVGGLGLTSVQMDRTLIPLNEVNATPTTAPRPPATTANTSSP
ncbi:MAG: metallophosphoesterase family protein [Actinomycetota bacterium]